MTIGQGGLGRKLALLGAGGRWCEFGHGLELVLELGCTSQENTIPFVPRLIIISSIGTGGDRLRADQL